jgi:hypothetical protein
MQFEASAALRVHLRDVQSRVRDLPARALHICSRPRGTCNLSPICSVRDASSSSDTRISLRVPPAMQIPSSRGAAMGEASCDADDIRLPVCSTAAALRLRDVRLSRARGPSELLSSRQDL